MRWTPCGRTRREFLWEAGGGYAGVALASLLESDGFFGSEADAADSAKLPEPHFAPKAKACIVLFMYGGPSQVDLFDPKPELTRRHGEPMPNLQQDKLFAVRNPGKLLGTSRKFSPAGKSGIMVSDLFPNVAKRMDDVALIRGMYADSFAHGSALLQMNTGFLRQGYPSLGSWLSYGLGSINQNLPGYVVMLDHRGGPISGPPNWSSGFMPAVYQGTTIRATGDPILNLRPPESVGTLQQRGQLDLLQDLHRMRGPAERTSELTARIASYELAFRMQAEAPEAVDIGSETDATKKLYGLDDERTEKFGRKCLLARRLVERGVRFVQVYSGGGHLEDTWDAHSDVDKNHETHCGQTDLPIAGLLADLKSRGLLEETLVVWTGEFGRTPTSEKGRGRDHNPRGFSAWVAGAGIRGGQVIGSTDDFGFAAVEDKVHVHDLHATILHLMGLDHKRLTYFHGGRAMRLTDVHGTPVKQLIG